MGRRPRARRRDAELPARAAEHVAVRHRGSDGRRRVAQGEHRAVRRRPEQDRALGPLGRRRARRGLRRERREAQRLDAGLAGAALTSGFYDLGTEVSVWKVYYGEDVATYAERSSLPGLVATNVPLFVNDAELDPDMFQEETAKLVAARAAAGKPLERVHLGGHSHISETYAVGTGDRSLAGPVARVRAPRQRIARALAVAGGRPSSPGLGNRRPRKRRWRLLASASGTLTVGGASAPPTYVLLRSGTSTRRLLHAAVRPLRSRSPRCRGRSPS